MLQKQTPNLAYFFLIFWKIMHDISCKFSTDRKCTRYQALFGFLNMQQNLKMLPAENIWLPFEVLFILILAKTIKSNKLIKKKN